MAFLEHRVSTWFNKVIVMSNGERRNNERATTVMSISILGMIESEISSSLSHIIGVSHIIRMHVKCTYNNSGQYARRNKGLGVRFKEPGKSNRLSTFGRFRSSETDGRKTAADNKQRMINTACIQYCTVDCMDPTTVQYSIIIIATPIAMMSYHTATSH